MSDRSPERGQPDLDDLLRALAHDDRHVTTPAQVREKVLAEWDVRAKRVSRAPRRWTSVVWLGRAAAVAAVAASVVAWIVTRGSGGADVPPIAHTTLPLSAVTGHFMAEPPLDTESLQIVRVRMPRGALRAFGFALLDPDADAEVEVDMVVGEDGFPRSIQHVQPLSGAGQQESSR